MSRGVSAVEVIDGEVTVTEAERAELERIGARHAALCAEASRVADAAATEITVATVRLFRERDEARARADLAEQAAGRLRAALRRFAEVFHEGTKCGVCGEAWGAQGYEHAQGCCVGAALTETER